MNDLTKLVHFYYCLQVSILIARNEGRVKSKLEANMHILKWVKYSYEKKLFDKITIPEIQWLKTTITKNPVEIDAEKMIRKISKTLHGV